MTPGRCRSKAHKAEHLGYAGRRVLVSRKWSNKTLRDHKADRRAWVLDSSACPPTPRPTRTATSGAPSRPRTRPGPRYRSGCCAAWPTDNEPAPGSTNCAPEPTADPSQNFRQLRP
ncbi:replication initiator [Streptosporangium sp. NPDC051022]|uniref:replication initiator n=1 Tax=Streptosporangium sp. NPDC051022 TaxID=3155752 RepID=UPI00341B567C